MSLPSFYKRAAFPEAGAPLTIQETELKAPGSGEVLVKIEACGVCGSDAFAQAYGTAGQFPAVPGHEFIGHIAAVGDQVSQWKVGDRVGGAWHAGHDGTCGACRKGHFQICDLGLVNGVTIPGGYAQYGLLRAEAAVRIPSHVDAAEYAPILCAGVTVFNSMRRMNIPPGSTVAVQGLGGLGHLAIQYARRFGFRVVAISRGPAKEPLVRQLGAHEYIDSSKEDAAEALKRLGGASMIVATASNAQVVSPLVNGLGPLGKLLILGVGGDVSLDTMTMVTRGLSVHGWPSGHALDSEEAIQFTELQDVKCLVERFPLDRANDAFNAMKEGTVRFRAVITME
ncbi:alcohol dehydrogenase [Penicillium capsulatum]|uniref:Alcohol dehydrogenase n=1 Tax=Penicillium capsulatum TaxID=69766 RepID=A0A9W9IA77_9EURO|nr:alcohol dehydrogenase [Penicillium capsulatum]KAJ6136592.1 alcohol dehydrogenase [Penicillium capsulatum]